MKKLTIILLLTMVNICHSETVQKNINISATIIYNCMNPDPKIQKFCTKEITPIIKTDNKYITYYY